jgi:hypothetical protein
VGAFEVSTRADNGWVGTRLVTGGVLRIVTITRHVKAVLIALIAAALVIAAMFILGRRHQARVVSCSDGPRQTIDMSDFETRYSGYSLQFQASIQDAGKFEGKISPIQLQQISDSLQSANEFRKLLVAGYDSCAVSSTQYSQYATRYQALDGLARQIVFLADHAQISAKEKTKLAEMTEQYIESSRDFAAPPR